jgi:hypothetical protein
MGPENKNDCAGDGQQQFTGLDYEWKPVVAVEDPLWDGREPLSSND